jgi:hypothetical protein
MMAPIMEQIPLAAITALHICAGVGKHLRMLKEKKESIFIYLVLFDSLIF